VYLSPAQRGALETFDGVRDSSSNVPNRIRTDLIQHQNDHGETHRLKEYVMQYFVQFDIHQPVDMSREELFTIWLEEARAAQGAVDAGIVTNLWKVVGQRTIFAVLDVPDHTSLDRALESLPIIQKLGGSVDTRTYPIRPYGEFAEEVRVAVEGQ
jgi:muconolactone delta-isomerase